MPTPTLLDADRFRHPLGAGDLTEAPDTSDTPDDGYYSALDFDQINEDLSSPSHHLGEDWNGEGLGTTDLGDPVFAFANGEVVDVVNNQNGATTGFGNYVVIRHDLAQPITIGGQTVTQVNSLYAHLDTVEIQQGDNVSIGEQIGTLGSSGFAPESGPHVHFEVTLNNTAPTTEDGYNPNGAPQGWTDPTNFIHTANAQLGAPDGSPPPSPDGADGLTDAEAIRAGGFLSRVVYGGPNIDDSNTDRFDFRPVDNTDAEHHYNDNYSAYLLGSCDIV